jgi:hypothetical protein
VFNLLVESSSQFGESENKNAGDGYPMKAIEKLVLRFLGSHTFSHGLGRLRSIAVECEWLGQQSFTSTHRGGGISLISVILPSLSGAAG